MHERSSDSISIPTVESISNFFDFFGYTLTLLLITFAIKVAKKSNKIIHDR